MNTKCWALAFTFLTSMLPLGCGGFSPSGSSKPTGLDSGDDGGETGEATDTGDGDNGHGDTIGDGSTDGGRLPRPDSPPPPIRNDPEESVRYDKYTQQQGLGARSLGASMDDGGTLWVVSGIALLAKQPQSTGFRRYTTANGLRDYPTLSVAGAGPDEAIVGYIGIFPDDNPDDDPPEIAKSGDADRLRIGADGSLQIITRYDIHSPPNPSYPLGRERLRTVFSILINKQGPFAGDIWFACNHGFALWSTAFGQLQEHQHVVYEWRDAEGVKRTKSGNHRGIALEPSGRVWFGGEGAIGRLPYASQPGGQFWADMETPINVWPRPEGELQPPDDFVSDLAMDPAGTLWVSSEVHGLASVNPQTGTVVHRYREEDGLPVLGVKALAADPQGSLWIGTTGGGIARLFPDTHTWHYYTMQESGIPSDHIHDIQLWRQGNVWKVVVATETGVVVFSSDSL